MDRTFSKSLSALAFLLLLSACGEAPGPRIAPAPVEEPSFYRSLASQDAVIDVDAARDMISLYRQNNGLGALQLDAGLQAAAQRQAKDMARKGVLDQSARGSLERRLASQGLRRTHAVENVSAGYHTLAEAFSGWRQSAPHNQKMLDRGVSRMGVATAYAPGAKYKVFWTLILTE